MGLFLKSLSLSAVTAMVAMMPARTGGDVGLHLGVLGALRELVCERGQPLKVRVQA